MVPSKLDFALVVALAAALLGFEHQHRIVIGSLAAAPNPASAASVCPDTDDAPFSAECLKFISGGALPDRHPGLDMAATVQMSSPGKEKKAQSRAPDCPQSDDDPPSRASCPRLFSGGVPDH